jgi:hypothetical protein
LLGVLEDPPGLAQEADYEEGKNVRLKKMNMVQKWILPLVVHYLPRHLRRPVVDAAEEGEHPATHDRVVEVGQDEEAPVDGDVDGTSDRKTPVTPPMRKLKNIPRQKSIGTS